MMSTGYFKKLREDICCNRNYISVDASHELTKFNDNFGKAVEHWSESIRAYETILAPLSLECQ